MKSFALAVAVCSASFLAACGGGGGSATTTITGTVGGASLTNVVDQASVQASGSCGQGNFALLGINLADVAGQCSAVQAGKDTKSTTSLGILMFLPVGSTFTTGTFNYGITPGGPTVVAVFDKSDASCKSTLPTSSGTGSISANAGSVTLTSISSSAVAGSFSFTFDGGGTLAGSFNAPNCSVTIANACSTTKACG